MLTVRFRPLRQRGGGRDRLPPQAVPCLFQPPLAVDAAAGMEARHEVAAIQLHRSLEAILHDGPLERNRIAPQPARVHADAGLAATHDDVLAEFLPQVIQRLPQRPPGARGVVVRPEQGEERVAEDEGAGTAHDQVGQERQPLGLGHDRVRQ
jgi:hypothetical protein